MASIEKFNRVRKNFEISKEVWCMLGDLGVSGKHRLLGITAVVGSVILEKASEKISGPMTAEERKLSRDRTAENIGDRMGDSILTKLEGMTPEAQEEFANGLNKKYTFIDLSLN